MSPSSMPLPATLDTGVRVVVQVWGWSKNIWEGSGALGQGGRLSSLAHAAVLAPASGILAGDHRVKVCGFKMVAHYVLRTVGC